MSTTHIPSNPGFSEVVFSSTADREITFELDTPTIFGNVALRGNCLVQVDPGQEIAGPELLRDVGRQAVYAGCYAQVIAVEATRHNQSAYAMEGLAHKIKSSGPEVLLIVDAVEGLGGLPQRPDRRYNPLPRARNDLSKFIIGQTTGKSEEKGPDLCLITYSTPDDASNRRDVLEVVEGTEVVAMAQDLVAACSNRYEFTGTVGLTVAKKLFDVRVRAERSFDGSKFDESCADYAIAKLTEKGSLTIPYSEVMKFMAMPIERLRPTRAVHLSRRTKRKNNGDST